MDLVEPIADLTAGAKIHAEDLATGTASDRYGSLRPKISTIFIFQEITLTEYILKNINIYNI